MTAEIDQLQRSLVPRALFGDVVDNGILDDTVVPDSLLPPSLQRPHRLNDSYSKILTAACLPQRLAGSWGRGFLKLYI
jgi:hypothetical protein